jgi:hypothetical protein
MTLFTDFKVRKPAVATLVAAGLIAASSGDPQMAPRRATGSATAAALLNFGF